MIRRKESMATEKIENMKGGDGTIILKELVKEDQLLGKGRLFKLITVEPGCSLGIHTHEHETEYFYVVKGNLIATDDGDEKKLFAGDVLITSHGHSHGIRNDGTYTAEMLAVILFGDDDLG